MAESLYIIDGHAHIYSGFYAPMRNNLTGPSGEPTKAVYIFTNMILKLLESKKPDMLVVTMDSKEPSFRAEIYPEYKAHRPPMPDEMPSQIARIEQILEAMNIPVIRESTFEADDIIGTLTAKAVEQGIEPYICSKDKDMLQLLDRGVRIYDVKTDKITDAESFRADTGLEPSQFIDVLALQGDTADNVPGVPLIGEINALKFIQKYVTLDNLYKNVDEIKGKRGDNLRNFKDKAYLSKELVTINCQMPIEIDREKFATSPFDKKKLATLFEQLGFNRLSTQLGLEKNLIKDEKIESQLFENEKADSIKTAKHKYQLIDTAEKLADLAEQLAKQKIFAFDTETTSISASRAELVGLSFCWQEHNACYLPVKGPMGANPLAISLVREKIGPVLADEKIKKIGQNAKYDMIVCHNAGMPVKGVDFDTMIASYVLDAQRRSHSMDNMAADFLNYQTVPISDLIGKGKKQLTFDLIDIETACQYAAEDADITFRLYKYLSARLEKEAKLKKLFYEIEMPLVDVLAKMEIAGVKVDVKLLKSISVDLSSQIDELTEKIHNLAGTPFNIDSPKQLAEILFDRLSIQSLKKTKTGKSTDAAVLEELSAEYPIAELLLQYRQLTKLKNTYADKLGTIISPKTGRIHASFNQTITATGRLSSSDPNLQNIPIRTEIGKRIRSAFIAEKPSQKIIGLDYSQVELRVLAHCSKDAALTKAFQEDKDIHSFVASQIYDVPLDKVTSQMRSRCKAVNFGLIYGQGTFGLSRTTGMSMAEAKKFISDYFARYSSIQKFKADTIEMTRKRGYVETISGRRRNIHGLESKNGNIRAQAERMAINTVIQGSAADLIKVAMIKIQNRIESESLAAKMMLQIHDELVFEADGKRAEEFSEIFANEMTTAIELDVPLKVDISIGTNWQK